ncbi:MAG: hypothetical protein DDT23_00965 [candidate division WS2 bacterium]|nr:hypothetical protein [Candidatus Lithacetigena glycinireducens]
MNRLTAFNPSFWAKTMQGVFHRENVAIALANTELRDVLVSGTRVFKPYRSPLVDQAYTRNTDITAFNDLTATEEFLDVDTCRIVPFYLDDLDAIENKWDTATLFAEDAQRVLNNRLDQRVLSYYSDSRSFISAGDLGGSGTGPATINTANIANVFAVASRMLQRGDVPSNEQVAVIGPRMLEILRVSLAGRETGFGDTVGDNGVVANRFGFKIVLSNNIPFTATLTESGQPSGGEFIDIDGVRFTFRAIGAATIAGDVSIGATAAATYANLVHAINNTGTAGASTYIAVSIPNRRRLIKGNIVASYAANVLTLAGHGDVAVVEMATNLVVTSNMQFPLFMKKGAIDLVVQKAPNVEFRTAERRLGRYVYAWTKYGGRVFDQQRDAMVHLRLNSAAWV